MRTDKQFFKSIALAALLGTGVTTAGIAQDSTNIVNPETEAPTIVTTTPSDGEMNVDLNSAIEITFSSEMDETTINETTLLLHATTSDSMHNMQNQHGEMMDDQMKARLTVNDSEKHMQDTSDAVNGNISYSNKVAVFTPEKELKKDAKYTFTVTNGVKNLENIALENEHIMSFTTTGSSDPVYSDMQDENNSMDRKEFSENATDTTGTTDSTETTNSTYSDNQTATIGSDRYDMERNEYSESSADTTQKGEMNMIDLGKAGQYVILAKTTINNETESRITGRTGEGSETDMTKADKTKEEKAFADSVRKSTSDEVLVWQSNQSDTASTDVSEAIEDMMSAHSAASMKTGNDTTSQMKENFHDADLSAGIHEWNDSLNIESDVTLSGSADDVWIFKIGNNLTVQENTVFTLTDGASADNIFWIVEGDVTIGNNANFEGVILSMNDITLEKGAKLNGRMFSQTSITLDDNTITEPRSIAGQRTSTNR